MSTYFLFKIGKINKDGKIEVIGPKFGNRVFPFYERSRSFVDVEDIETNMRTINADMVGEKSKPTEPYNYNENYDPEGVFLGFINEDYITKERTHLINAYFLEMDEVRQIGKTKGLVMGYTDLESAEYINRNGIESGLEEGIPLLSSETVAGIANPEKRGEYVHVAGINTQSFSYICSLASELFDDAEHYIDKEDGDSFALICEVG